MEYSILTSTGVMCNGKSKRSKRETRLLMLFNRFLLGNMTSARMIYSIRCSQVICSAYTGGGQHCIGVAPYQPQMPRAGDESIAPGMKVNEYRKGHDHVDEKGDLRLF